MKGKGEPERKEKQEKKTRERRKWASWKEKSLFDSKATVILTRDGITQAELKENVTACGGLTIIKSIDRREKFELRVQPFHGTGILLAVF